MITQFYSRSPGLTVRMIQLFVIGFFMIQITMASEEYEKIQNKEEQWLRSQLMRLNRGGYWKPESADGTKYHLKFKLMESFDLIVEKNVNTYTEIESVHNCEPNLNDEETTVLCTRQHIFNSAVFKFDLKTLKAFKYSNGTAYKKKSSGKRI